MYLICDDGFQGANTSAGGAFQTTGLPTTPAVGAANEWTDVLGGIAHIGGNEAVLTDTNANGYQGAYVVRPPGEGSADQDFTVFADLLAAGTRIAVVGRFVSVNNPRYYGHFDQSGGLAIFALNSSGGVASTVATAAATAVSGHYYALRFQIVGTSITLTLYDQGTTKPAQTGAIPTLGTQIAQASGSDSSVTGIASCVPGLAVNQVTLSASTSFLRFVYHQPSAGSTGITLFSPEVNQIFPRSTRAGSSGNITISGYHNDTASHSIVASFTGTGGSPTTIAVSVAPFTEFTGTLPGCSGQGNVNVYFADNESVVTTVANVALGAIFAIWGQSNAGGKLTNNQTSLSPLWTPGLFANNYIWQALADPTDSGINEIDTVSYDSSVGGSVWPIVATQLQAYFGCPVGFIPCALGGTTIAQWQPGGASHLDRSTLYGSANHRIQQCGGVEGVLFWQGENDAVAGTSASAYLAALESLLAAVKADIGAPLINCRLQGLQAGYASPSNLAQIQAAIAEGWSAGLSEGPDLSPITCASPTGDGGAHLISDAAAAMAGALWTQAIIAIYSPAGAGLNATQLTITSNGTTPVQNAACYVTSDSAGLLPITGVLYSDSSGHVTFNLTTGTEYYLTATLEAGGNITKVLSAVGFTA
jgi:hypothetical protein